MLYDKISKFIRTIFCDLYIGSLMEGKYYSVLILKRIMLHNY